MSESDTRRMMEIRCDGRDDRRRGWRSGLFLPSSSSSFLEAAGVDEELVVDGSGDGMQADCDVEAMESGRVAAQIWR